MGWELRVFVPGETARHVLGVEMDRERREDQYMVVSIRVGIKRRGGAGAGWEVKIRYGESEECPGLERWDKETVESVDSAVSILKRRGVLGDEEQLALERRVQVIVEKQRQRGWSGGVLIEETDLVVKWGGKMDVWRSWCIEGGKEEVEKFWSRNWSTMLERDEKLGRSSLVMGYPEWVGWVTGGRCTK